MARGDLSMERIVLGAALGIGAVAAAPFTGGGSVLGAATLAGSLSGIGKGLAAVTAGTAAALTGKRSGGEAAALTGKRSGGERLGGGQSLVCADHAQSAERLAVAGAGLCQTQTRGKPQRSSGAHVFLRGKDRAEASGQYGRAAGFGSARARRGP